MTPYMASEPMPPILALRENFELKWELSVGKIQEEALCTRSLRTCLLCVIAGVDRLNCAEVVRECPQFERGLDSPGKIPLRTCTFTEAAATSQ